MEIDADRGNGKKLARIRPTTSQRGYGTQHQRIRAALDRLVRCGAAVCARCGGPIEPDKPWDLGRVDGDRSSYAGPEHRACNRATSARKALPPRWSRRWFDDPAPGTEVTLGNGLIEVYVGDGY